MRLLAIDTALEACAVGIVGGAHDVLNSEVIGRGHAERLMGMIAAAMEEAGLTYGDLDRIAVTVGPGSFTGLRVGLAAARGFSLVTGCPVVGIGTLAVFAATARRIVGDRPVLAVLDARRGEVFGQAFAADGAPIGPPEVAPPAHFTAGLRPGTVVAGSGADLVAAGTGVTIAHRRATADIADLVRLGRAAPPPTAAPPPLCLPPPDAKPQANAAVARR